MLAVLAVGAAVATLFLFNRQADERPAASAPPDLLFRSGYEGQSTVDEPSGCSGRQCWQYLSGTDPTTGYTWRNRQAGNTWRFQLLADALVKDETIGRYMVNRIEDGTGRNKSRSLYSEIRRGGCCGTGPQGGGSTQDPFLLEPMDGARDMYLSYWLKFQPDLLTRMGQCAPNIGYQWRVVFEWKAAGDYRSILQLQRDRDPKVCGFTGPLYWVMAGDNAGNCNLYAIPAGKKCPAAPINRWSEKNRSVAVPVGEWFKLEVFWHRSDGDDGRMWVAAHGEVIFDHRGPNMGDYGAPINRIMAQQLYTSTAYPAFQWVDDLQVWKTFPTAEPGDAWYDPPYAPH